LDTLSVLSFHPVAWACVLGYDQRGPFFGHPVQFKNVFSSSAVSFHIVALAYVSLVMTKGERKQMTLEVTVALNVLK
jgi:hypothetical protein